MEGTLGEKDNDTKIAYNEIYTPEYKYKKSIIINYIYISFKLNKIIKIIILDNTFFSLGHFQF